MSKENRPCPFCGNTDCIDVYTTANPYYVTCPICGAFGPDAETKVGAWEKWNKRSDENDRHNS